MDWKALERGLFDSGRAEIERLLDSGTEPLYAAAFHASYREEGHVIDLPCLAANTLLALGEDHPGWQDDGYWGVKWNPADWGWNAEPEEYGNDTVQALAEALQAYANRAVRNSPRPA